MAAWPHGPVSLLERWQDALFRALPAMLIAQGEHPKVIQFRLGHSSIKVTLDTYRHHFEGLDEAAADRLDTALLQTPWRTLGARGVVDISR